MSESNSQELFAIMVTEAIYNQNGSQNENYFWLVKFFLYIAYANNHHIMPLTKRTTRKLISTWPQRLALSGMTAFTVWSVTEENLFLFASVWLVVHLALSLMNSRIPEVKTNFNEEMRY